MLVSGIVGNFGSSSLLHLGVKYVGVLLPEVKDDVLAIAMTLFHVAYFGVLYLAIGAEADWVVFVAF